MVKSIASYILVFVLIILLTISIILSIASETVLNEDYALNRLEKEDYYSKTYTAIIEEFKDNTIQSGLDEEVLDNIITIEQVKEDVAGLVDYIYNGRELTIGTATLEKNLGDKIDKIIDENDTKISSSEREAINIYKDKLASIYTNKITFSQEYIKIVRNIVSKVEKIGDIVKPISYISTIVIILLLIAINREEARKYFNITAIASGMLLIIPKIFEKIMLDTQNILIINKTLSTTIINAATNVITILLSTGIVLIILGLISSAIEGIKRKKYEDEYYQD